MAVVISAVEQDVYPPRILITLTGLTVSQSITVWRQVAGVRTAVRGADEDTTIDTSYLVLDAELPFGVSITYVATVAGVDYAATPMTAQLADGPQESQPVFTDAITGLAAEAVIVAWPELQYDRDASQFRLASGDTAVISGPMGMFNGPIDLYVATTTALQNFKALLEGATGNVVQIRQGGNYTGVDSYVSVLAHRVRRFSQDGTDPRRLITLEVAEVSGWASGLEARGYTLQDLADVYDGLTLANLGGDYATQLLLAQAELVP